MTLQTHAKVLLSCVALVQGQLLIPGGNYKSQSSGTLQQENAKVSLTVREPKLCDPNVTSYSGYFNTSDDPTEDKKLFYWFFESRNKPSTDPVVLWLTGGPGCSSMLAILSENGPCKINEKRKAVYKADSWTNKANVVWVDQPAGTGFSVGSNTGHMYESIVGVQMYGFLQAFFTHFTQFQKNEFFITGESYGGHYVPAVSHAIWQGNKDVVHQPGVLINLKGLAIGNGMTDPLEQFNWYPEMAYDGGKSQGGTAPGVVTESVYNSMKAEVKPCIEKISQCKDESTYDACAEAQAFCSGKLMGPYEQTGMNVYDQRIPCAVPGLCYNFSAETDWLNSAEVQKELGVAKVWETCNFKVNGQFSGDWMLRYDDLLVDMLHDGIRVLIYAGDCDFICNWIGNKHWTLKLDWPHKSEFNAALDNRYMVNDAEAGRLRMANGFAFMQIYQAGHMVPLDQAGVSVQMLNEFISNTMNTSVLPPLPASGGNGMDPILIAAIVVASLAFIGVIAFIAIRKPCGQARSPSVLGTSLAGDNRA